MPEISEQEAAAFGDWLRRQNIVPVPKGQESVYGKAVANNNPDLLMQFREEKPISQRIAETVVSPITKAIPEYQRAASAFQQGLMPGLQELGTQFASRGQATQQAITGAMGITPQQAAPAPPAATPTTSLEGYSPTPIMTMPEAPTDEYATGWAEVARLMSQGDFTALSAYMTKNHEALGLGPDEVPGILKIYQGLMKGEGAGGDNTAAYLARQTALDQLAFQKEQFQYGKEQDVLTRQMQVENEKQRVKEAMAGLQMQGVGALGSAYSQALSAYERATPYMLPQSMQHIPGYQPGGAMEKLSSYLGTSFTPRGRESTSPANFTGGISPLQEAINQVIAGAR